MLEPIKLPDDFPVHYDFELDLNINAAELYPFMFHRETEEFLVQKGLSKSIEPLGEIHRTQEYTNKQCIVEPSMHDTLKSILTTVFGVEKGSIVESSTKYHDRFEVHVRLSDISIECINNVLSRAFAKITLCQNGINKCTLMFTLLLELEQSAFMPSFVINSLTSVIRDQIQEDYKKWAEIIVNYCRQMQQKKS